ncbi:MAG: YqeG family HAD IIIA-type phosphatase [Bacilli bacterium]|nr:YqeG family HAD IIIA-type phosphatase [Bacilli bacterium]
MKYIPKVVVNSLYDIDFTTLYEEGFRFIISDLDNTLASYKEEVPSFELINKIKEIKELGFKFYLVSNNKSQRIETFTNMLNADGFLAKAEKPRTFKMEKFLEHENIDVCKLIGIGDQLVTDILGFNRLNAYSILVKTIDKKTQKWYTKINRLREIIIIKRIKKENLEIGSKIEKL